MQGKHILLGVSGGIAAYKSPDLVRRLRERGAEVQVVMTAGAREFVTATTFQAVSGRTVRTDLWDAAAEAAMGHIELARWAELVLVAPASADFLARLASGHADDLLATLCLATAAPHRAGAGHEPAHVGQRRDAGQHGDARRSAACTSSARLRAIRPAARSARAACSSPPTLPPGSRRCWRRPAERSPGGAC